MPLGNPIRKQNESRMVSVLATEGQTVFTVQGGYIINHISVFRNGVRLSPAEDFTAGDGSTVTLNDAANVEDRIDFHIFDRFTVQNAIIGAASTQTINGDLVLTGKLFGELDVPSINLTGIVTATELDLNGKGDISGDLNVVGVTTLRGLSIFGNTTGLQVASGISTFQALTGTTGTFSGDITANGNIVGDNATNISGISSVTATTFHGDGSNLTGITQTTITGNANNRVITGSDTSNTLIAESGLTYDTQVLRLNNTSANPQFHLTSADDGISELKFGDQSDTTRAVILYRSGSAGDALCFNGYNNTERMRITSAGLVGIGTISPGGLFHTHTASGTNRNLIEASASHAFLRLKAGSTSHNSGIEFYSSSSNIANLSALGGGGVTFEVGGSERVRIDSSGNFMIGATSASGILHVEHSGENNSYIVGNTSTSGARLVLQNKNTTANSYTGVLGADAGGQTTAQILFYSADNDNNEGYLTLGTRPSGGLPTERVRITSSGDFGIGTTSPDRKLDVSGTGNVYGKFQSTNATGAGIELKDTGQNWLIQADNGGSQSSLAFYDLANTTYRVHMKDNGNVEIVNGDLKVAAGHGIDFSAQTTTSQSNTSVQAELLNHYEEGTWTPRVRGTSGAGTATHNQQNGRYTRIGNVVHCYFKVDWSSGSAGGELLVDDFPFTCASAAGNEGTGAAMFSNVNLRDNAMHTILYLGNGTSYAYFYSSRDAAAWYSTLYDSAGAIIASVSYRVD